MPHLDQRTGVRKSFVLMAALLAALGSARGATAAWAPPATLGQSNLNFTYANNVSVAVSSHPKAQSVAVWVEPSTMVIKYAVQRNGIWTAAKTLYTADANAAEEVTDPQVVVDRDGLATAVWGSTKKGPVTYCVSGGRVVRCVQLISFAKVAKLAPGRTTWSKANLSSQAWTVTDAQVAIDQGGNAVATWVQRASAASVPTLQAATRMAGRVWTAPVSVYASAAMSLPRLSVGPTGAAVAVWSERLAGTTPSYAVRASSLSLGSTWGAPETVATQATPIAYLRSTVDGNAQAAVVWDHDYGVEWARRGGGWTIPEALSSAPGRVYAGTGPYAAYGPDIVSDGLGNVLITWLENDMLANGTSVEAELVLSAAAASHTSWPASTSVPPSVAMSSDGSLGMVAWLDEGDANTYAVSLTPSAGWSQAVVMSSGAAQYSAVWGTGVSLAAGENQRAAAAWLSVAGLYGEVSILGSSYQP